MSKQTLPEGQDNVIVRNQEVYGFLPKDVIDRLGDTSTQLATEDQTALGAINELKSNLTDLIKFKNLTHSYTVAGNGFVNWNPTSDTGFDMTGYTPVGIVIYATNNTSVTVLNVQPTNNAWGIALRNVSSSSQSNTFSYTVMYIKDFS